MQAKVLHALTKLAAKISNPSSLTSLYRSIELGPEAIRSCSEFGNIELAVDNSLGLTEPVLLDFNSVDSQAKNLPGTAEITLTKDENKIRWVAGAATGFWSAVASDHKIPHIDHKDYPWTPSENLGTALQLAGSACQAAAVSLGLYGITIEPKDDKLHLMSCNTLALAASTLELGTYPFGKITVRPPVPGIIAALLSACPNCALDVTKDGIYMQGDWLKALLPLGHNLDRDLKEVADKFTEAKIVAKIDNNAVKKFIKRAQGLSETNTAFTVKLRVQDGKLALEHAGINSATEEVFLCEGLDLNLNLAPISLPADMLMQPLQFVQWAVFDYLGNSNLVLKGENPLFTYVLSGGED